MKIFRNIILGLICLFLICWTGALIKCEMLSWQHSDEFSEKYRENTMLGNIDYLKVLEYNNNYARVYVVSSNKGAGDILLFAKKNNQWQYDKWERTVWSDDGSASGVIWPYWWHIIYGGL